MPLYESTFVVRQDVSRADVTKIAEFFTDIVKQQNGKVVKNEYWGLRNLAYKINKNRKGHYVMLGLNASHEAVKELERNIGLHEDVVRHLTVRVDAIEEGPSVMLQKSGRDEEETSQAFEGAA
ncbi:MAG TPA: 30S ribosomal protein S6 [Rickettsiales bacterium]|nr:30S ribosomal protein S6 [Rickettsiales bacterium]